MSDTPKTNNQRRKAISVSPEVYERYMARLASHREAAGYMVSNNELITWLLSRESAEETTANEKREMLKALSEIQIQIAPVELRADVAAIRAAMNVDSYRLSSVR